LPNFVNYYYFCLFFKKLQISKKLGFKAGVFLTRHDNPLGFGIGNQIEIEETIECLHGNLSPDIQDLVTKYGKPLTGAKLL
jgi:thymidine phosphorylase